jgi:hypothetical protein
VAESGFHVIFLDCASQLLRHELAEARESVLFLDTHHNRQSFQQITKAALRNFFLSFVAQCLLFSGI